MTYTLITTDNFIQNGNGLEFEGATYGNIPSCFIMVNLPPGRGPRLHRHPYPEIFIVQEGQATYTVGTETVEIQAGQIVIVPANVPHKFVNSGTGQLKQVDIHPNAEFSTEWLEE